jgi:hypothetical protein
VTARARDAAGSGALAGLASAVLLFVVPVLGALVLGGTLVVLVVPSVLDAAARATHLIAAAAFCAAIGILLLVATAGLISSCAATTDFCGNANPVPMAVAGSSLAVAALALSALAARVR